MNNGLCDRFCPALMNDANFVTDYRPSRYVHNQIMRQNGIHASYDMKKFLQENAVKLQNINRQFYECKNRSGNCSEYYMPDPNRQIAFWDQYKASIGYNGSMNFCVAPSVEC